MSIGILVNIVDGTLSATGDILDFTNPPPGTTIDPPVAGNVNSNGIKTFTLPAGQDILGFRIDNIPNYTDPFTMSLWAMLSTIIEPSEGNVVVGIRHRGTGRRQSFIELSDSSFNALCPVNPLVLVPPGWDIFVYTTTPIESDIPVYLEIDQLESSNEYIQRFASQVTFTPD